MSKKKLLYISSLPKNSQSGGANAVNYHTYKELQKYFDCRYVQINPHELKWGKRWSQFNRKFLKRPGYFNFFSQKRLKRIAEEFSAIEGDYDVVFFRGFTPWVYCQPKVPYLTYNDVHFLQFFNNTFTDKQFVKKDIQRICLAEKEWLSEAKAVLFESQWGADQCKKDYNVPTEKLIAVGRGGHIPIPKEDQYEGSFNLVIIANSFYQKGGDLVFEAFKILQPRHKKLQLHIIGGNPGDKVIQTKGVVYHGYLYKEKPDDLSQLTKILSRAFLLMHITREDINPLVPTEAGYFGCPTISVQHFAIPELIKHNITGLLLPYLPDTKEIARSISHLIEDKKKYLKMRTSCWDFNRSEYSWYNIGKELKENIDN